MPSVETAGLEEITRRMEKLARDFPEERRAMLTRAAEKINRRLAANITESGIRSPGKIAGWQRVAVGSRGGYAAVRPVGSAQGASTGRNSPGAITNYLEHGHRIRPRGTGKGYRPRIRVAYVNGYHFYRVTQGEAGEILWAEGKAFCEKLAKGLEGTG